MVRKVRGTMTPPEVERLTTSDAARRLGVSPSTVRRRIATGHLRAETHPRPQGVRYVVLWDLPTTAPGTEVDSPQHAESIEDAVAQIERTAWYWWLVFPAVVMIGLTLGRLLY